MCELCNIFLKLCKGSGNSEAYLCQYKKRFIYLNKIKIMGNLLYVIAVILLIAWAIGFFAFSAGGLIHILLVIAIIAIILRVIQGRRLL